jgi:hypothetical protein
MAINLLRLARFVDGERPSAEKFNKLFSYIENKLSILDLTIGDSVNNGVTSIVDNNTQTTFDIKINNIWGISKFLAENIVNGRTRHSDIMSIVKSIGSMSNLNPLTLGGESIIKEVIPAGINEYVFKYPVLIQDPIKSSLTFLTDPIWLNQETGFVEENGQMLESGQWKLWKFFEIDGENNTTISYAKSMVWYTTSTTPVEITYKTNSENWGGGANYQGSSFNVIPDFNTPKEASNTEDINGLFYNLKFTNENNITYTTVELPYVLYQQTAHSKDELDTALLNEGDINFKKRLKLPKYLKDYQLTLDPPTTEFPLPKGFLTLVDFSEDSFTILDGLNYIYVDEHTFKVNINPSIYNCVTADPSSDTYKQLFLLVNGTDITRSINDLQIKQSKHSHDGTFGESLIHIKDITGIFEKTDRNVYFPSARGGHIATQYLHRDGHVYNNDPQNYDNAMMGDLLMYGEGQTQNRRSYKLFFADHATITRGVDIIPGHSGSSNSYSWIGLASTVYSESSTLNLQSSLEGNISILSDNANTIVSKNSNLILIKEVVTADSLKLINGTLSEERVEDLKGTSYIYQDSVKTEIHSVSLNKIVSYLNDENHSSKVETNYSSDTNNLVKISANKGLVELETKDFEINYKNYDFENEEPVKTSRPIISLNISSEENINSSLESAEKTKSTLILNNTNTEKGIFVYTVHHLVNRPIDSQGDQYWSMFPNQSGFFYSSYALKAKYGFDNFFETSGSNLKISNSIIGSLLTGSYDYFFNKALRDNKSLFDATLDNSSSSNFYLKPDVNPILGKLYIDQSIGDIYICENIGNSNTNVCERTKVLKTYLDNSNSPYNKRRFRWIWNNPYPTSMEYLLQYITYFSYQGDISNQKWSPSFKSNLESYRNGINTSFFEHDNATNRKTLGFDNIGFLTKMVWRKWFIKDSTFNTLDVANFFDQISEIETELELNIFEKDNIRLVDSGLVIDRSLKFDNEINQDSLITDLEEFYDCYSAFNRKCRFFKKKLNKKEKDFLLSNSDRVVLSPTVEYFTYQDLNVNVLGSGLTGPFSIGHFTNLSENGTIDPDDFEVPNVSPPTYKNKINLFNENWEELEFEEDDIYILFGKGFMNFNLNSNFYNMEDAGGSYQSTLNDTYVVDHDIAYVAGFNNDSDEKYEYFTYTRDLKIKLKKGSVSSFDHQKDIKIKIIYSDFFASKPNSIHNCFNPNNVCAFLEDHSYFAGGNDLNNSFKNLNTFERDLFISSTGFENENFSFYPRFFNQKNWNANSLGITSKIFLENSLQKEKERLKTKFFSSNASDPITYKKNDFYLTNEIQEPSIFAKEPNTFFSSVTIEYADLNEQTLTQIEGLSSDTSSEIKSLDFGINKKKLSICLKILYRELTIDTNNIDADTLAYRRFVGPTQPIFEININSNKTFASNSFNNKNQASIVQTYNIKVNTQTESCALLD